MFKTLADNTRSNSVSNKFRRKRFKFFLEFIKDIERPVKILDLGGTVNFWSQLEYADSDEFDITIVNIEEDPLLFPPLLNHAGTSFIKRELKNEIKFIKADAADLSRFKSNDFDIIFSNSLIEHIGSYAEQKKFAEEIMRTGKKYFIQTPNYYFPFEPHFLFPCFQFFPQTIQIFLLTNFKMGWFQKCSSANEAKLLLNSINLLKKKTLIRFFTNGKLYKEKILFFTKSFIIYKS